MTNGALSLRAKRSNLSIINNLYLLIRDKKGCKKTYKKKKFLHGNTRKGVVLEQEERILGLG
ncbi:MAG: hypothetical protein AYP45_12470 [Candidatus Brocadia carolinensis]|uniref:Uncharacterized protein n=1 Tax=Candidatus Brocadia carolinensis TaxID=1004156 RepID=A0A1V4ART4_9BACT|nr:MAG: hypothetical protein AYP45_12470 [Candidatus Brocadia caroliniensis]